MTLKQAIERAEKRAKETGETRYVVREAGEYHIASEYDLDTFFMGLSDDSIAYASGDWR